MTSDPSPGAPSGPRREAGRSRATGRLTAGPARHSRLRRRIFAGLRMLAALTIVGIIYTAFAPVSQAEDTPKLSAAADQGKRLYDQSCISCHGPNAQGVEGRGPSLIGVGAASVEFQVGTGRMPMTRQEAQAERKPPQFNKEETRQLGQYIQELGGGPQIPAGKLTVDPETHPEAL